MDLKGRKIYCCTPVAFIADESTFFIRDTGLVSRSMRNDGAESKVIMPLPYYEEDLRDEILRTEYKNLESAAWWRSLQLDAVILYSWAYPRYLRVARAIHKSGTKLIIHLDTNGFTYLRRTWNPIRLAKDVLHDFLRSLHLNYADLVTMSEPVLTKLGKSAIYSPVIRQKGFSCVTPVAASYVDSAKPRQYKVTCVGRWSDSQADEVKRPEFCLRTAQELVRLDKEVVVEIYGHVGQKMESLHRGITEGRERVLLKGFIYNEELPAVYGGAMVNYCPSMSEGTHISSAEALCCGCSVAVTPRRELNVVQWYTTRDSGSVSEADTPESLARAIHRELQLWKEGKRNPEAISNAWRNEFAFRRAICKLLGTESV